MVGLFVQTICETNYCSEELFNNTVSKAIAQGQTFSEDMLKAMKMRFVEHKTLEEVGKAFGVTRERVKQIESKFMRKVRDI